MDRVDLLRTFVAVAETGAFTAAAQRLNTTPQLTSKYIRALEDQWGVQLFIRSTRSVRLTETGKACLERCSHWVEDFDELAADIRQEHREPRGRLKISAPTTFGEEFLVPILPEFAHAHPQLAIDLNLTDRFINLVEDGYDVAVRIGSLEDSSLIARRITRSAIVICAAPSYLESGGFPQTVEDLAHHRCVVDTNFRDQYNWPFQKPGEKPQRIRVPGVISVNSASAVRNLLVHGAGIGLCPYYVVQEHLQSGELVRLFADYTIAELGHHAVYLENRYLSAKIRTFVDFLVERLGDQSNYP